MAQELVVLKYRLDWKFGRPITIEATQFDAPRNMSPSKWAIRDGDVVLSKKTGMFRYEPNPSNRDDAFLKDCRFDSVEEAQEFWNNLKKE